MVAEEILKRSLTHRSVKTAQRPTRYGGEIPSDVERDLRDVQQLQATGPVDPVINEPLGPTVG